MGKEEARMHVGGQAVIEGVMMRSPKMVAVAVRRSDGKILLRREEYVSWTKRFRILGTLFIRGGVVLIESLVLGIRALNFSGEVAMEASDKDGSSGKETGGRWSKIGTGFTVFLALGLGIGLFFYLPLLLTEWTGVEGGVWFNLVDGGIRLAFFLAYLGLISLWKEIRRVFEYHGAEHKAIFAYEDGRPLTLEAMKLFKTHHPRCGTSFLLVVMLVALLVFICLGRPETVSQRLIRFLFIPIIGGISYEIIRLSNTRFGKSIARVLVTPGLWLQRITTKEPDDGQQEVALVALKSALGLKIDPGVVIHRDLKEA
jgi:uncharacterized protein YqhQ